MTPSPPTQLSFAKLFVKDFEKSVTLVKDVFGLNELEQFRADENGRLVSEALFGGSMESTQVAIVVVAYDDGNVPAAGDGIAPIVRVGDLASVIERARAKGYQVDAATGDPRDGGASAVVYTSDGHPFTVTAEGGAESGSDSVSAVTSVQLMVSDIDRNVEFFEKAVGLKVKQRRDLAASAGAVTEVIFEGEPSLRLVSSNAQSAAQPSAATYVGLIVDDVAAVIERVRQQGGDVVRGSKPSGGGPVNVNSAVLAGFEGHRIEVAELA